MKIERELVTESTLEAFAGLHDLTLCVRERDRPGLPRYIVTFRGCEVMTDGLLRGAHGEGDTEEAAIADYAKEISQQRVVFDAYGPNRTEIPVPRIVSVR